jgi:hypothetical protein
VTPTFGVHEIDTAIAYLREQTLDRDRQGLAEVTTAMRTPKYVTVMVRTDHAHDERAW